MVSWRWKCHKSVSLPYVLITNWDSKRVAHCAHIMWFMMQSLWKQIHQESSHCLTRWNATSFKHTVQSLLISVFFPPCTPTLVSFGCWLPVFSTNYWQTNLTLFIDVRVIDLCFKCNLRRFERIFCWKVDFDSEGSFVIWRIVLQQGNKNQECSISDKQNLRKSKLQASIYQMTSF